ncbi:MAG TPA: APC family permease [Chthoniobacterales bacterium]|nr:APC family permease [Chthoniobacterales bacterium]
MVPEEPRNPDAQLERAIGVPGLAANIINTTIGASIFALPALVAQSLGAAAPLAFIACGIAMTLFVTCFALAGSRVALTGGLYAYAEVAFGRYVGFITGLFFCTTALLSVAAVVNFFVGTVVALAPWLDGSLARAGLMFVVYAVMAAINIRGVRAGAGAVGVVTIAKLIPLFVFVVAGVFFIDPGAFHWPGWPPAKTLGDSVLLLLFAFFGIEVALIPSGEVKTPARTVPRAIYMALALTTALYILIQVVAQGTLGSNLAAYRDTPLAEAANVFLGNTGRLLLLAGATISGFGFIASDILSSPRILFAFGRDGILPRFIAHVHPRWRSPDVAILVYSAVAFLLSLTSTFASLAIMANVAALLLYIICCAAAWELIRRNVRTETAPFTFPGASMVPIVSIVAIIWILSHATMREFKITGAVFGVGSLLYLGQSLLRRQKGRES